MTYETKPGYDPDDLLSQKLKSYGQKALRRLARKLNLPDDADRQEIRRALEAPADDAREAAERALAALAANDLDDGGDGS